MHAIIRNICLFAAAALTMPAIAAAEDRLSPDGENSWSLVIHGGAGTISRDRITAEKDAEIRAKLTEALEAGEAVLAKGGTATDGVIAAIMVLEDDPNFNAGKGAVLTWDGDFSLDSSIMEGNGRKAGSAAGTSGTKNPILLARAVMDKSRHVLLSGQGADAFARAQGLEQVEQEYFTTPSRVRALEGFKRRMNKTADASRVDASGKDQLGRDFRFGTVGAVALDKAGNIAAGTSTGGMTGKRWGRIGDSPIIGAGTYADNRSCGISATGAGEYFIRVGVAQEFCTRVRLRFREMIKEAQATVAVDTDGVPEYYIHASEFLFPAEEVQKIADEVMAEMGALGGSGGVIYITPWGHTGYSFDTPGMYRGTSHSNGTKSVAIYGDETGG
ncbi:MAG: isoaspartyl peptidase/L-asparaginase [Erythrobacter sp.]